MEQQATVATPSPQVQDAEQQRQLVRTLMGGTFAMRQAKTVYLPKHPAESENVYRTRLEKTFLDNFVEDAISKATGKLFAKEIKADNLPTEIETLIENIDRQGRGLNPFMMDVARQAFIDGISYVMADMPPKPGNVVTLADEKQAGLRPYAIHIKPCCILEVLSEMIGGVATPTRVRIMECVQESNPEGWGHSEVDQVRVWYRDQQPDGSPLVQWETYRQQKTKTGEIEWVLYDQAPTTFKAIYLVPFYTNRSDFMMGVPGFQNIAESNLEHWQWKSEHAHALSMCCFGMYTATGVPEEFKFEVGPAKCQTSNNPDAKFGVLETTGTGVTLSADTLRAIESRIATSPVNLRVENAGQVTATAAALDSEETSAGLKAIANGFSDSIETLFQYFGEMMGIDATSAEAEVNTDFGVKHGTDVGLQEIGKYRALGDISREGALDVLRWRGEIPPDFDVAADAEKISQEGPALGMIPAKKMPDQHHHMPDKMQQGATTG